VQQFRYVTQAEAAEEYKREAEKDKAAGRKSSQAPPPAASLEKDAKATDSAAK
jgi:hypothetical protein